MHRGHGQAIITVLADGGGRYASKLYNPAWLEEQTLTPAPKGLEFLERLQVLKTRARLLPSVFRRASVNVFEHGTHIGHRSHFHRESERQSRASFRDLGRFIDVGDPEKEISAHHFLRLRKRTIDHGLSTRARHHTAAESERPAMLNLSLGGEPIVPIVPGLSESTPLVGV